jgi:hypothetical protein
MIIRTVQGRSFKGVGLYVLHDKGGASDDRVAFTETVNLATNRGNVAVAHMIDTATHANDLKIAAGLRASKKVTRPVYHYTLSWETSETPSKAEQIEAARESLDALGLSDRQALIVAHTDTDNPHVHVVVNRVHPETGVAAKMGNDRLKLSNWAEDYRRKRGQEHFCKNRQDNNRRRRDGEFVKDTKSLTRQEWMAWKRAQTGKAWEEYRQDRDQAKDSRKGLYDALWRQKEDRTALRRDEIKALYKPVWRDVFKRQRKELADFDAGIVTRIRFALSQDRGKAFGVVRAIIDKADLRRDFVREQERERRDIGEGQKQRIADAAREIRKAWQFDRDQLRSAHREEDAQRLAETKARTDEIWKQKRPDQSQDDFEQNADRRKPENKAERDALNQAPEPDKKRARRSAREIMGEQRKRSRSRTRRPRR